MLDFFTPTSNGVPAQTGDFHQLRDAAASPFQRQHANKPPTVSLIESDQHPINGAVMLGHDTVRMLLARLTHTGMNNSSPFLSCHRSLS
jgi:hypothetical protein